MHLRGLPAAIVQPLIHVHHLHKLLVNAPQQLQPCGQQGGGEQAVEEAVERLLGTDLFHPVLYSIYPFHLSDQLISKEAYGQVILGQLHELASRCSTHYRPKTAAQAAAPWLASAAGQRFSWHALKPRS